MQRPMLETHWLLLRKRIASTMSSFIFDLRSVRRIFIAENSLSTETCVGGRAARSVRNRNR